MKALLYLQRVVPLAGVAWNRLRFLGLWTGLRVEIDGWGRLVYGKNVRIGEGSRIDLFADGRLTLGPGVVVGRNAYLWIGPGMKQAIGAHTVIQDFCRLNGNVIVGKGCVFAPNVFISSGTHAFDQMPHRPILEQERLAPVSDRPVRVFDDCWFGINAVVSLGVTIGRGCVIGSNSVVTRDLPPYSVAAGVPARVLRQRLEFKPKARIEAVRETDGPYFYDGFELIAAADSGEHVADGDFTLALDRPGARIVRLCLSGDDGEIGHGDNRRSVPRMPEVIEFPLAAETTPPFLNFRVSSVCRLRWAELA